MEKENAEGQQKALHPKMSKGLISKCLEKDPLAFKQLQNSNDLPKGHRISILTQCRPKDCQTAVDLFLWLIEVVLVFLLLEACSLT